MAKTYWGFNTKDMDKSVRPQDDFYSYANGGWLGRAKIPAIESRWGTFVALRYKTEYQLKKIVASTKNPLIRGLYGSAIDMKRRNMLGEKPMTALRMIVRDIKDKETLQRALERLHIYGYTGGFGTIVDQDSKDSTRYILHLWQGGLGMPERDYYLLDKPEQKRVRDAYIAHIARLLKLAKFSAGDIARAQKTIMKIETALAKASMKKEDLRDPEKIYHKYSLKKLQSLSPALQWQKYFDRTYATGVKEVIVGQPEFFKAFSKLLSTVSIEEWKVYLEWHVINGSASYLSQPFVKTNFAFYGTTLTGVKKMKPLWRQALGAANWVGEVLGKLYVESHFPPAHKKMMNELVSDLFEVYAERIKNLDWMSPATKKKALAKLKVMSRKIGYPRKWEKYAGLSIDPKDYFGNALRTEEWEHKKQMRKLRKPVDRDEWFMFPHTVNAYFAPNLNDIVFPAAILQWPFFDPKADAAINYAAIGSVIGHEMTHGFDDSGSKFDGKGNLKSWWTAADRSKFEKKSKLLVEQYGEYEAAHGVYVNGQLTLGENIADLGGLNIGWDAYQKHLKKTGRKIIGGFSPEERFFLGFAQYERELSRPEMKKMAALTDPHSPPYTRINGTLANFEPFYKTFKLSKKDKLYREPKKRAQIW